MVTLKTMTLRIAQHEKISGFAARSVRDILKKVCHNRSFDERWLAEEIYWLRVRDQFQYTKRQNCLDWLHWEDAKIYIYYPACRRHWSASLRAAPELTQTLIRRNLIELDEEPTRQRQGSAHYRLTDDGRSFCRAIAAKPVQRKSAEEALRGFMERVRVVNQEDRFLYRVTAVVLYGSYVRGAERPADVDLAIEVERKIDDFDTFHEACWKHLQDAGRACQRIGYELEFPHLEVFVFLRQRKRTLSLHSLHDFIVMEKHDNFSYEVLLGDRDVLAQKLQ
jgi:predicted nucleotidyltransferase